MSPFLIFAISLTIAYAIYYAVMITRDLYGKKVEAKTEVKDFLSKLLVLTESEKKYVREFNDKKYIPELLFEDKEMVNRIKFHPMLCEKQGVVECFFCKF